MTVDWDQLERARAEREAHQLPAVGIPSPRAAGTAPGTRAPAGAGSYLLTALAVLAGVAVALACLLGVLELCTAAQP